MNVRATPVLSRLGATLVAFIATVASTLLVGLNALVAGLACGDDGPLDYGTGGDVVKSYCQASFDASGHFTRIFTSLSPSFPSRSPAPPRCS
jgi:hypothetical protein